MTFYNLISRQGYDNGVQGGKSRAEALWQHYLCCGYDCTYDEPAQTITISEYCNGSEVWNRRTIDVETSGWIFNVCTDQNEINALLKVCPWICEEMEK